MKRSKSKQSGVMLLEALISLLIFAIGVLGLMGMQAMAIKVAADSKYRGEAAMHADQIINQMWADDRTNAVLVANYSSTPSGVKYEVWRDQIQGAGTGLPGSSLSGNAPTVTIDANNLVTVTIRWQPPNATAANRYVTVARLN
jgi:type IV pilus assembly protein PilV